MQSEIEAPLVEIHDKSEENGVDPVLHDEIGLESLDYEPIQNEVLSKLQDANLRRRLYGYTGVTLAKWSITFTIGILIGIVAYVIAASQEFLVESKKQWIQSILQHGGIWVAFLAICAFGLLLVFVSSCLVLFWAPAAAGGGVTLVMAYLNGNDIPDFFSLTTLFSKILGTICTISSGLPIGQEGPMIHIGAAIASSLTWMQGKFPFQKGTGNGAISVKGIFSIFTPKAMVYDFHNDKDRREFISAGTAAGLAAAFGAPIGGVLFSFEEASSFWSKKVMWRSLLCASVATVVLSWLHAREFSFTLPGFNSFRGIEPQFVPSDLPLFFVTSSAAGLVGAALNTTHGWLAKVRPASQKKLARLAEACLVLFICVAVMVSLPYFFGNCLLIQDGQENEDRGYWFQYKCPNQYYNDLATLYFSTPHQSMQRLFEMEAGSNAYFSVRSLGIHSASYLILFILSYGIATPGGIFMPSMMVGGTLGAFLGCIFASTFPGGDVQPGLHALIGSTAMLGGVFRASISLVVIMVEATGGIDFILPVILAIVVSNWVAHHIHNAGAYEADLERLGDVCFLHSEPPRSLMPITAADIMSRDVVCFQEIVYVQDAVEILKSTTHNGFPVLRNARSDMANSGGILVGLILRHQLLLMLEQRAFHEMPPDSSGTYPPYPSSDQWTLKKLRFLDHAMRVYHHGHHPHQRYRSSRPEALQNLNLEEVLEVPTENETEQPDQHREWVLDLRPFMNRAPLTVRGECSAQRVYLIVRTLGLRHLCVTNSYNRVIGIITRKDISHVRKFEGKETEPGEGTTMADSESKFASERSSKDMYYYLP